MISKIWSYKRLVNERVGAVHRFVSWLSAHFELQQAEGGQEEGEGSEGAQAQQGRKTGI